MQPELSDFKNFELAHLVQIELLEHEKQSDID